MKSIIEQLEELKVRRVSPFKMTAYQIDYNHTIDKAIAIVKAGRDELEKYIQKESFDVFSNNPIPISKAVSWAKIDEIIGKETEK